MDGDEGAIAVVRDDRAADVDLDLGIGVVVGIVHVIAKLLNDGGCADDGDADGATGMGRVGDARVLDVVVMKTPNSAGELRVKVPEPSVRIWTISPVSSDRIRTAPVSHVAPTSMMPVRVKLLMAVLPLV